MDDDLTTDVPVFALGLVALPHEQVPLHIFEPRYRAMVTACLEQDLEFVLVWADDDGAQSVGCLCAIEDVIEQMEDGRMNILVRGTAPVEIVARHDTSPYPTATIAPLPEQDGHDDDALTTARAAYAELVLQVTEVAPEAERLASLDAYAMAATVDFGNDAKQTLLELRSEPKRLAFVTRLFLAATKRLDFIERAQARARSNGKVRFG